MFNRGLSLSFSTHGLGQVKNPGVRRTIWPRYSSFGLFAFVFLYLRRRLTATSQETNAAGARSARLASAKQVQHE